jgi:4-amino-4-deoxychorismate lyase
MDRALENISLIETLRYEPEQGFVRLRLHLARLERSARRLDFPKPSEAVAKLQEAVVGSAAPLRVRLTFDSRGRIEVTTAPFAPLAFDTVWTVRVATTRLDSNDKLLRVKTTRRGIYEAARAEYSAEQADEVILLNERGDVAKAPSPLSFLMTARASFAPRRSPAACSPACCAPNSYASARPVSAAYQGMIWRTPNSLSGIRCAD